MISEQRPPVNNGTFFGSMGCTQVWLYFTKPVPNLIMTLITGQGVGGTHRADASFQSSAKEVKERETRLGHIDQSDGSLEAAFHARTARQRSHDS